MRTIKKDKAPLSTKAILKKFEAYLKKHKGPWLMDKPKKSVPSLKGYIISEKDSNDENSRLKAIFKKIRPFYHKFQEIKDSSDEKVGKKQKFSKICKEAFVSRQTFYDIYRTGETPSKDTVLKLAFSLNASFEEAKSLLNYAGYTFGECVFRDLFFKYCFENGITNIAEIDKLLIQQELKPLVEKVKENEKKPEDEPDIPLNDKAKKILSGMADRYYGKGKKLVVLQ